MEVSKKVALAKRHVLARSARLVSAPGLHHCASGLSLSLPHPVQSCTAFLVDVSPLHVATQTCSPSSQLHCVQC